jgi:hypothetical protein
MNNTIRVLLIVVAIFLLVGFVRGWFFFTTNQEPASDKVNVNLTIDTDKMKSDAHRVGEAASDLTGEHPPAKTEPANSEVPSSEQKPVLPKSDEADPDLFTNRSSTVSPELAK